MKRLTSWNVGKHFSALLLLSHQKDAGLNPIETTSWKEKNNLEVKCKTRNEHFKFCSQLCHKFLCDVEQFTNLILSNGINNTSHFRKIVRLNSLVGIPPALVECLDVFKRRHYNSPSFLPLNCTFSFPDPGTRVDVTLQWVSWMYNCQNQVFSVRSSVFAELLPRS